jgi:hypothetical protein
VIPEKELLTRALNLLATLDHDDARTFVAANKKAIARSLKQRCDYLTADDVKKEFFCYCALRSKVNWNLVDLLINDYDKSHSFAQLVYVTLNIKRVTIHLEKKLTETYWVRTFKTSTEKSG